MSAPSNPTEIARETFRLLATRRIAPDPDNYRKHYLEIAGQAAPAGEVADPAEEAALWAKVVLNLVKQWETRHVGVTTARKREGLERLLGVPGSSPAKLANKLRKLVKSWSETPVAEAGEIGVNPVLPVAPVAPDAPGAGPLSQSAASPLASKGTGDDPLTQLRELLAQTLEFAATAQHGSAPDLAQEAASLAKATRAAGDALAVQKLAANLRQFWFKLELRGGDNAELHKGLLRLLRLLIENAHELVSEDQWISGQLTVLRGILGGPLDLKSIAEAERRLKEVVFKQSTLKNSLDEAKAALKALISRFIERLGELSQSTGGYHDRLEGYAGRIRQSDDISQLNVLLDELLRDTRLAQVDAARTRDDLVATRQQVEAAESKVRALESELDKVSELTQHDQLTGALNRRGLEEACQRELARSDRTGAPLCLGLLDIDNFKQLNDTLGHRAGDDALQHLVGVIDRTKRPSDVLARYGGEEFLLLLPDTAQEEAVAVMTRLQRDLTKAFFPHDNKRVLITFSAGVAQRQPAEAPQDAIERADKALYRAKHAGKNCVFAA